MKSHQATLAAELSALLPAHTSHLEQSAFPLLNKRLHEAKRTNRQHKSMKSKRNNPLKQSARR